LCGLWVSILHARSLAPLVKARGFGMTHQRSVIRLRYDQSFASLKMTKLGFYAVFCILLMAFAMASSMPRFISSMDKSLTWVPIDHLWPKGSWSLP
jgi:hypothetical protein